MEANLQDILFKEDCHFTTKVMEAFCKAVARRTNEGINTPLSFDYEIFSIMSEVLKEQ